MEPTAIQKAPESGLTAGSPMPDYMPQALAERINQIYFNDKLDQMFMIKSEMMAKSNMIPVWARGDQWACYSSLQLAFQWEMNVNQLMTKLYKIRVDSPVAMEGQLVQTVLEKYAPLKDHYIEKDYIGEWEKILGKFAVRTNKDGKQYRVPNWKMEDEEGLGIIVRGTDIRNGKVRETKLLMSQCLTRNSTLWAENPKLQIWYRAISVFGREHFPGILLGLYMPEEVVEAEVIDVTPENAESVSRTKTSKIKAKLGIGCDGTEKKTKTAKQESGSDSSGAAFDIRKHILDELARSGSPFGIEAVEEYLSRNGITSTPCGTPALDNFANWPEAWQKFAKERVEQLVSIACKEKAEEAENKGNLL